MQTFGTHYFLAKRPTIPNRCFRVLKAALDLFRDKQNTSAKLQFFTKNWKNGTKNMKFLPNFGLISYANFDFYMKTIRIFSPIFSSMYTVFIQWYINEFSILNGFWATWKTRASYVNQSCSKKTAPKISEKYDFLTKLPNFPPFSSLSI